MDNVVAKTALESSVFEPMNESQMALAKGGNDIWGEDAFQQMVLDWIDDQMEDPTSVVTQILSNFDDLTVFNDSVWGNISNDMEDEGLTWPDPQELYDTLFAGGNGNGL